MTELLTINLKLFQSEERHALNFRTSLTLCSILVRHRNVLKAVCCNCNSFATLQTYGKCLD